MAEEKVHTSDVPPVSELTQTVAASASAFRVRAVSLRILKGSEQGITARVDRPLFIIGSGQTADLRISDPGVSREHLRILLDLSGARLQDTSKNGTYIGGMRVRDATLSQDTAITIGGTTIQISIEPESIELPLSEADRFGDAIGSSTVMRHMFANLERIAGSDLTVLIEGESGVGKDLLARGIHQRSPRYDGPFVVVDCGAIPANLVESELFGHERGAFTGATESRRGMFEEADGGTIFLDEIGELPLDLQPKLLRALEQREIRRVGARAPKPVNVRVIAATNRRLAEGARTGEFRTDLYYRLAVARVTVPPLRDRTEDILPIARVILRALRGDPNADFPADFSSMLAAYPWPGNVRELRNVVERYAVFGSERGLFDRASAVARSADDDLASLTYHEARKIVLDRFEEQYLPRVLERASGVMSRAAELAGVARPSFYRMMARLRPSDPPPGGTMPPPGGM
ncbi:MAG: sigma 54-dependent Fis family transcriptional regulator [Myxococcales bacterium]|nr:sigma 54-dependent Fis family transcriptional regulator [Myxococcales bacterium]